MSERTSASEAGLVAGAGHLARRSAQWFGVSGRTGFLHRSWMRAEGFTPEVFDGRPVIGIANSFSELTPCNSHLDRVAEAVKRGVWQAGGFPLEFPTMSLGETLLRPTAMLYRNLMAMEVEENLRANPLDGVVLLSGCDKTTPAMLMGAASVDLPAILVTGGPMLRGRWRGHDIGSGTDVWRLTEEHRAGRLTAEDLLEAETCMNRSNGHCMTMGTASTMACMAEALGMSLKGSAVIPAPDAGRMRIAQLAGQRIVEMVLEDGPRPSQVLTRAAFENAIRANAAIGGSTNAVIHLMAIAGRVGVELELEDFDRLVADVPLLVDLMPSGKWLMEDFHDAGGLPVVLAELAGAGLIDPAALTISGKSIGDQVAGATSWRPDVVRSMAAPVQEAGSGTAILRGNLCPDGAVIKISAATPELLAHRGRAVVFDSLEEYLVASERDDLDVSADDILVLRYAGPRGYPGMPEVGNMPLPAKILRTGVTDMVRISDARMSGTGYGTVVLHAAPEAAAGGPLALVRTGDMIELDAYARRLVMEVSDEELASRRALWTAPEPASRRGWTRLYVDHVLQADKGCDLDFLVGSSGDTVPRENH
ncbi:MAG: ilvD [Acidimicrobiaceae bacterium]|jgi:dihydroxy-acid dehydratase|nr:ilvD [Acidimicrobiaceae bacterium]